MLRKRRQESGEAITQEKTSREKNRQKSPQKKATPEEARKSAEEEGDQKASRSRRRQRLGAVISACRPRGGPYKANDETVGLGAQTPGQPFCFFGQIRNSS